MHAGFNRVNNDGITAGLLTGDTRKLAAIVLTAATAVIIRGRLGRATDGNSRPRSTDMIEIHNLTKIYGAKTAVDHVNGTPSGPATS